MKNVEEIEMAKMTDAEIQRAIADLFVLVDELLTNLEKNGHPIPPENSKTFYLQCCYALSWLNRFNNYKKDPKLQTFRDLLILALPEIKDADI
jgi:hypothetical protein